MRKKAMRVVSVLMAVMLLVTAVPLTAFGASVTDFTDVKEDDWFYDAVKYAVDEDLFSGTDDDKFSPNVVMNRAMFVTVLGRKNKVDKSKYTKQVFSDVKTGSYFAPYVQWASENDIVAGTSETTFSPTDPVTRQQMATMLYRYAEKTKNDTSYTSDKFNSFPDTKDVAEYALVGMKWATSHEIINGSGGKLLPKSDATRAQVATIFMNSHDILINTDIDPKPPTPTDEVKLYVNSTGKHIELNEDISSVISKFGKADDDQEHQSSGVPTGYHGYFWNTDMGKDHCFYVQTYHDKVVRMASADVDMNLLGYTQQGATGAWNGERKDVDLGNGKTAVCGTTSYPTEKRTYKIAFAVDSTELEGTSYERTQESIRGAIGICMTLMYL